MKLQLALSFSIFLLAGCVARSNLTAGDIFLPKLSPPQPGLEEVYLTAALKGQLVVDRGCVKVAHAEAGRNTTVLWHQGTEVGRDDSGLFLRNAHTGNVYRFNRATEFGGGTASEEYVQREYPEVARRCGPPYASGWLP